MYIDAKNGSWGKAGALSDVLISDLTPPAKIAVIGAGGKTSVIAQIAEEQRALGRKVLSITTTHIAKPQKYGVIDGSAEDIKRALECDGIAVCGVKNDEGKLSYIGDDLYHAVKDFADVILVEADGSKRLPVKVPAEWEPVIPPDIDLIVVAFGLSALGKAGNDACHRWALCEDILTKAGYTDLSSFKPYHLSVLLEEGYLKPMRNQYINADVITVLNQADDESLAQMGRGIIEALHESKGVVMSFLR